MTDSPSTPRKPVLPPAGRSHYEEQTVGELLDELGDDVLDASKIRSSVRFVTPDELSWPTEVHAKAHICYLAVKLTAEVHLRHLFPDRDKFNEFLQLVTEDFTFAEALVNYVSHMRQAIRIEAADLGERWDGFHVDAEKEEDNGEADGPVVPGR